VPGSLTSSDVYESYTDVYTWASNQAAHLGLGCLGGATVLVLRPDLQAQGWVLFIPYGLKELNDFRKAIALNVGPVRVPRAELVWDSTADFTFFSIGVCYAWLGVDTINGFIATLASLAIAVALFASRFIPEKRAFDKAGLPYFFRLGTYLATFAEAQRRCVVGFGGDANELRHLVLRARPAGGRMTLAVALASECTVLKRYIRYYSAGRFREALGRGGEPPSSLGEPWTLAKTDILVVDDVEQLDLAGHGHRLTGKRCIWVLAAGADAQSALAALIAVTGDAAAVALLDGDTPGYRPRAAEQPA